MPGLLRDLVQLYQHIQDPNKDQRQQFQLLMAQDPSRLKQIIDSESADNPQTLMNTFGISNARWGGNKNAGTNIANAIVNTPLSEQEKAKRLDDLQNDVTPEDISNASIPIPQLRAYNGVTNSQFAQQVPQIAAAMGNQNQPNQQQSPIGFMPGGIPPQILAQIQQGNRPSLLNPQMQDIRSKSLGLPTAQESQNIQSGIDLNKAQTTKIGLENQTSQQLQDANNTVDNFFNLHPDYKSKPILDIFNDGTVPGNIKDAISMSPKYGKALDTQLSSSLENQRIQLEKASQIIQNKDLALRQKELTQSWDRMTYVQAADAWRQSGMIGGTAGLKGFQDAFAGNPNTPEAQQALKSANTKLIGDYIDKYNVTLQKAIAASKAKGTNPDEVNTLLNEVNGFGNFLQASGVPVSQLKYAPQVTFKPGLGGDFSKLGQKIGGANLTIQTVNGNEPTEIKSNNNAPNSTDLNVLKKKAALYDQIKAANPTLPPSVIQSRVEAQFKP